MQLSYESYEAKSVRVCGVSELSLVPSIVFCGVMYSGEYNVFDVTLTRTDLAS